MTPILILGAGTMAVEVLEIVEAAGGFEVLGFAVNVGAGPAELEGYPVHDSSRLPELPAGCRLVSAIVSTRRRMFIEDMESQGFRFASVIHPSAQIAKRAKIADGCIIHPGVVIASNTSIGAHTMVNRGALIGHDNAIEPFVTIGPGANLAGAVTVGTGAYLGVGCVIRDHTSVGAGAIVGAGAVVVKPVPANTLVGGVPAQVLRTGVEGL